MSTKTTFKRIALVTVAALGFGVLTSVAPASATNTVVVSADSAGFGLNTSSITMVDSTGTDVTPGDDIFAAFEVSVNNANGYAAPLQSGESLKATVIANPNTGVAAATANSYINVAWASAWVPATGAATSTSYGKTSSITSSNAYYEDVNRADALRGGENKNVAATYTHIAQDKTTTGDALGGAATATYALMVGANELEAFDAGFYSIRIDLLDTNSNAIQSSTVKFQIVTSKVGAGTVAISVAGPQATGGALLNSATQNITATLTDANGGLVRTGANAAPQLSGSIVDGDLTSNSLTWADAGTDAEADTSILDGVYVAANAGLTVIAGTATAKATFGNSTNTADLLITGTGGNYIKTSVTATGKVYTGGSTTDYDVPLTTKAVTVKATVYTNNTATVTVADAVVYYTLAYNATYCVTGDMSPTKKSVNTKATADANGVVTIDITNANPLDGCIATVVFSGGTAVSGSTNSLTRAITWSKPVPTSVTVSPAGNYSAVLGSTHKVTWTILDQFLSPVVGSTVQFTATGANAPTAGVPSVISDASGQVSYTWTDAAGVVDSSTKGFSAIALKSVGTTTTMPTGKRTVTYVTTMPAITSLYSTYTTTVAGTATTGTVPTTSNIGSTTGVLTSAADQVLLTASTYATATKSAAPWVTLNFQARKAAATSGTDGVPTTVTVTGAKLIGSDGKLATSTIVYANEDIYVLGTTAGIATVTAVNGTVTSTATINFVNAEADARVLSMTESAGLVTATVKDAFGSAVSGVSVAVVGTGGAWLGNGSTSTSFTTSTDGTVTFSVTGAGTVTGSLSSTTYPKASFLANAGNTTGTVVTTGSPAGVRSATVTTLGRTDAATAAATAATAAANAATAAATAASAAAAKAGADAVAAANAASAAAVEAATAAADAAAEATDAANAATDAANASAEAGDAATAAAQDAADAVAALSTQVSEMISALKAQLTALTNLVIKIQKKVKA